MLEVHRIDEIIDLLQAFALGEVDLPRERVMTALRLLDWAIDDAPPPPDDGVEALRAAFVFAQKYLV